MIKNITTRCFVVILVLFMLSVLLRFFTLNILMEKLNMENVFTRWVFFDRSDLFEDEKDPIDWAARYPFKKDATEKLTKNVRASDNSGIKDKIERYTTYNLINRIEFVLSALKYENATGWRILNGNVYDLGDGYISEIVKKIDVFPLDRQTNAGSPALALFDFYDFIQSLDIDFLYIQNPHKISRNDRVVGASDFSNDNADDFLRALATKNIPCLDLRENIRKENLDYRRIFYKGDNHWKTETGLWVASVIARYLNDHYDFAFDLNLLSPERFRYEKYKDWLFGWYSKKVTTERAKPEDITLIYPSFETDFSLKIPSKKIDKEGSFDIFYDYSQVSVIDYYNLYPYDAFLYGNNSLTEIHNKLINNNRKILIIKDSFADCVVPFLSLGVEEIQIVDLRYFSGSIQEYIVQNKPELVIVMYNPDIIEQPDYGAHNSFFDFR